MFFIPGWLMAILTFPGVVLHEWAHKKYCEWTGVKVLAVKYFDIGKNPAGYVLHEEPTNYSQIFWISVGPLIINSFSALFLSFLATQTKPDSFLYYALVWVAISAGMNAFPSTHDTKHILNASKHSLKNGGSILHYLAYPFFGLFWFANIARIFWFDLIFAIGLLALGGLAF